ncbi:TorD/DmsD family molecular chaperone [Sulfurospirillum multivorans]|uniref:Formate dehydrogenase-specific chaperone FdhX n=2 Tax=Sulfurospirillum multivorans TaxID=66821 RepID=A0AA86E3R8_SULMK|nr:molecular chaperone TorD family protein [Sulfurospirillum multivorans]AHJ14112.1 formate dehydrogenase-specific chaperone FdhX [Sulfurospirillum multivorans DSM 12446]QEH07599.1 formate dehydrogenase-specific chaperone FdhX [Sulfurospirillum multivorans]
MINKESVNKARSLYYGFLSKMFVFTTQDDRYLGINEALEVMIENPMDENSGEALKEIHAFLKTCGQTALIQEYDDIFHNPAYKVVRNTASYYDEGVESGHQRLAVKNFLAKTKIRRDENHFKENEDSVGFIFTFMHELIELIMQGGKEYEYIQHCLFVEVINPFMDEFVINVYEHPMSKAYQSVAIVLNAFMAFERMYFEVAKPPLKERERVQKPVEVISGAEARRRAENKAKKEADKAKNVIEV